MFKVQRLMFNVVVNKQDNFNDESIENILNGINITRSPFIKEFDHKISRYNMKPENLFFNKFPQHNFVAIFNFHNI